MTRFRIVPTKGPTRCPQWEIQEYTKGLFRWRWEHVVHADSLVEARQTLEFLADPANSQ